MAEAEKTAAELAAEERELAIKRGDIIPEDDENEAVEASAEGADESEAEGEAAAGKGKDVGGDDAEGEGDADEGASAESSATEAASEEGKDEGITIPKARFDEAQQKHRAKIKELEDRLRQEELKHARETTDADLQKVQQEIDELANAYEEFLLEGEVEKARAARKQLDAKREAQMNQRLIQQSQQTGNAAVEQIRYETKLAILEEKYPALNPDSADYNEAVLTEVAELKSAFESKGWGSTAALEKAVHYVIRDVDAPPATEDPDIKKSQRAHKARKAAAAAAKATPPDASKAGRDSDKGGKGDGLPDVTKMTPEQFAKWAEADPEALARLRGDTLSAGEAA